MSFLQSLQIELDKLEKDESEIINPIIHLDDIYCKYVRLYFKYMRYDTVIRHQLAIAHLKGRTSHIQQLRDVHDHVQSSISDIYSFISSLQQTL